MELARLVENKVVVIQEVLRESYNKHNALKVKIALYRGEIFSI